MKSIPLSVLLCALALLNYKVCAQSTPPATKAELEALYYSAVENRTAEVIKPLALSDAAKSNQVHDIVVAQYHALRSRDEAIDTKLQAEGKTVTYSNRAEQLEAESKPIHDQFLSKLSQVLTPDQVDKVKDAMTYNKVTFTYNAYCNIVPGLTDAEKAKILELLKAAREEAMDGGSASEKSSIFQKYKDQIDAYLNEHGHDVAKAKRDWQTAHPAPAK